MPLPDTKDAIGAVSGLLRDLLTARTSIATVDIGRPEASAATAGPKFNLFLYQIDMDASLRNHPLDRGQKPPLWLALRYLLTAFDSDRDSDSAGAHRLLGEGMGALQTLNFIEPVTTELADNPEPLKVTFDSADVDLLSKIMQGTDEKYRVSAAFQIRPVLIATGELPSYAPLVKSVGPADQGPNVLPSLGPRLTAVEPAHFVAGDEIDLRGQDLDGSVDQACLDGHCFPVTAAPAGRLRVLIPSDTAISAGSYSITVSKPLPSGHRLTSNAVAGQLLPVLTTAVPGALTADVSGNLFGPLTLTGTRIGSPSDAIFVAFASDQGIVRMLEAPGAVNQDSYVVNVEVDDALPPGTYRILLRVNGAQAADAPKVDWS